MIITHQNIPRNVPRNVPVLPDVPTPLSGQGRLLRKPRRVSGFSSYGYPPCQLCLLVLENKGKGINPCAVANDSTDHSR